MAQPALTIDHFTAASREEAPAPRSARARPAWAGALAFLARSHVVHFLVLGGLVFAVAPRPPGGREIHLTREQLAALYGADARRGGQVVSAARRHEIDARAVEDEVLYREALRLGLDRGDGVVRQRLIQKTLFLAEDLAGANRAATDAELRRFYAETRSRWTAPERVRLIHVFAAAGHREALVALRPRVIAEGTGDAPPPLGEAFPISRAVTASGAELAADYGPGFAEAVMAAPVGAWSEPVDSKLGLHLVKVVSREPAHQQSFEEARGRLKLAYLVDSKERATRDYLTRAWERYRIDVDGTSLPSYEPSGRTAPSRKPVED